MIRLVRDSIPVDLVLQSVASPAAGAVAHFLGVVRNHNQGRRVLFLEYEAYEPMALRELQAITDRMREQWPVEKAAIVHRLGRVEIGEASVAIAVSTAHRGVAFDACRWAIDTLKKNVPIWKKEHFEGGEIWIGSQTGAAFPPGSREPETAGG